MALRTPDTAADATVDTTADAAAPDAVTHLQETVMQETKAELPAVKEEKSNVLIGRLTSKGGLRQIVEMFAREGVVVPINAAAPMFVTGGTIMGDKASGKKYGNWVVFQPANFHLYYKVTPGLEKMGDEEKKLVKKSLDGKTLEDGTLVSDYVAELKDAGYQKARMAKRAEIHGFFVKCDKGAAVEQKEGDFVVLYLAPSGVMRWDAFVFQQAMKGDNTLPVIKASVEQVTNKSGDVFNTFMFAVADDE